MRQAVIDLGTNTFQLIIVHDKTVIYEEKAAAKLGLKDINNNFINAEAQQRAFDIFTRFKEKMNEFEVSKCSAIGTSAIRNAENKAEFVDEVKRRFDIDIQIIDGVEEANLIYLGVKNAVNIKVNSLIMDIGGGSVEFIICNENKVLWLQSFEIGGMRLMEKFVKRDPISESEINRMNNYFQDKLLPLTNAIHQYQPQVLIGSSGSFSTLNDIYTLQSMGTLPPNDIHGFEYPIEEFWRAYDKIIFANREERLKIPGMIDLRVDLIVVGMCLIRFVLQTYGIKQIQISEYSLKEGVLYKTINA